jgi:hypothetical protein
MGIVLSYIYSDLLNRNRKQIHHPFLHATLDRESTRRTNTFLISFTHDADFFLPLLLLYFYNTVVKNNPSCLANTSLPASMMNLMLCPIPRGVL